MAFILIPNTERDDIESSPIGDVILDVLSESKWGLNDMWEEVYTIKIGKFKIKDELFRKIVGEVRDMFIFQKIKEVKVDMDPLVYKTPNISKKFKYYWCARLESEYYVVIIYIYDNNLRVVLEQKSPYIWTTNHETRFPENSIQWDAHWNCPFKLTNIGVHNDKNLKKINEFFIKKK